MSDSEENKNRELEAVSKELQTLARQLQQAGRNDLLLRAIGVPLLEELHIEAARGRLSRLRITEDYRFFLVDYDNREVDLQPVHKAVYLLFLHHPEGIAFKLMADYRQELLEIYKKVARSMDLKKIEESVNRLTNPLDNAINEKCSRIKNTFLQMMDEYTASYYIISGHTRRPIGGTTRTWYERLKIISLPRELVIR